MTDKEVAEINEIGAIAISHTAVLSALFGMLRQRGVLSGDDVNQIFDTAQRGLEIAERESPDVIGRARRVLDQTSRNLASDPTKDA